MGEASPVISNRDGEEPLVDISRRLEDRDYFEDRFTMEDLLMPTVRRDLPHTDLVQVPQLAHAY